MSRNAKRRALEIRLAQKARQRANALNPAQNNTNSIETTPQPNPSSPSQNPPATTKITTPPPPKTNTLQNAYSQALQYFLRSFPNPDPSETLALIRFDALTRALIQHEKAHYSLGAQPSPADLRALHSIQREVWRLHKFLQARHDRRSREAQRRANPNPNQRATQFKPNPPSNQHQVPENTQLTSSPLECGGSPPLSKTPAQTDFTETSPGLTNLFAMQPHPETTPTPSFAT